MKLLYLGSSGPLSVIPFQALLDSGSRPCAVALEHPATASATDLPLIIEHCDSLDALARINDVPVVPLPENRLSWLQAIGDLEPDIVVVSCFGRVLPDALLKLPALGCFNLHPSLLPAYRGPVPLFWQFRDGCDRFGITLHRLTSCIDAGPVVSQAAVPMPDGVTYRQASEILARAGAKLLLELLGSCGSGPPPQHAQDERMATYQGFPADADYTVSTGWPARRLYNFVSGNAGNGRVFPVEIEGRTYRLTSVLWFREQVRVPVSVHGKTVSFACREGSVCAGFVPEPGINPRSGEE